MLDKEMKELEDYKTTNKTIYPAPTTEDKIRTWLINAQPIIKDDKYISIHIDRLLGLEITKNNALEYTIDVMKVIKELLGASPMLKFGVYISLVTIGSDLLRNPPQTMEILQTELDFEPFAPPSVFIIDQQHIINRATGYVEEYKCPLPFVITDLSGCYTYYGESRDKESMQHNWEFSRTIYIECCT